MKNKIVSIVIPVYNEQQYIEKVLKRVITANTLGYQKEIIIIDDGSTDQTPQLIKKFISQQTSQLKAQKTVFIVKFKKINEGKGAALKTGFSLSSGNIVLIQDADLEYNPSDYPIIMDPFINNEADVVFGSRLLSGQPHRVLYFWHYFTNITLTLFSNILTNLNLTDIETGSKTFRGEIIRNICPLLKSKRFGIEPEIVARIAKIKKIKIFEVGIQYNGRTYEEGKKIKNIDGIKAIFAIIRFNLF